MYVLSAPEKEQATHENWRDRENAWEWKKTITAFCASSKLNFNVVKEFVYLFLFWILLFHGIIWLGPFGRKSNKYG